MNIIIIDNIYSKITGDRLSNPVIEQLNNQLSYALQNSYFIVKHMNSKMGANYHPKKEWDGKVKLFWYGDKGGTFYTGMASEVTKILKNNKISYVIEDHRVKPAPNCPNLAFKPLENAEDRPYQDWTVDISYKATRGIIEAATGSGKCLGKGTLVLMFNGSAKPVEEVIVGDLLMGPDSLPRTVKSIASGNGELYLVKQNNGDDFVCNDQHILCLQRTTCPSKKWKVEKEVEISALQFCSSSKCFKHLHKGYKVGVEFKYKKTPIDPYWLGLWLGDGNSDAPIITTGDDEIVNYIYQYAKDNKMLISVQPGHGCKMYNFVQNHRNNYHSKCVVPNCEGKSFVGGMCRKHHYHKCRHEGFLAGSHRNKMTDILRKLNLINNKHIPNLYKYNNRKTRLKLLAGLIDTDGSFSNLGSVEFCNTNKILADDVC